jgi:protein-S-isoprenylcysteine O-methyltransferase Ste14
VPYSYIGGVVMANGPYQFSRNPIYGGFVIGFFGIAILMGSHAAFIGPILFFIILNLYFIPSEEKMLSKTFGQPYLDYQEKVRRWK